MDGEKIVSTEQEQDPLYGETYLPRKFKSGLAIEGDNCIDVYSQDLGMVAHLDDGQLAGFTILVGGGMGMTHNQPETYPLLAKPLGFVRPEDLTETFVTIIEVQRDHGRRDNRRRARMKYLVEEWGIDRFRAEVERRLGRQLAPPRQLEWNHAGDHFGWHKQADGKWYLGVFIENGRLQDANGVFMKTAFREVVEKFKPGVRLTSQQNIIFADVTAPDRAGIEQILRGYGVPLAGDLPTVLLNSMACPAIPTCGLAVAESERALPSVVRRIYGVLAELGLGGEKLSVRMTGCPNGCARPYIGDIGLVGRTLGKYQLYVGGDFEGTRMNSLLADLVPTDEIHERLRPLFALYRDERNAGEGFGDFCNRVGLERLKSLSQPEPALV
jgi:sulfite reductase (ferredoxin)